MDVKGKITKARVIRSLDRERGARRRGARNGRWQFKPGQIDGKPDVVIELTSRSRMKLGGPASILATNQGVWAGIQVMEDGHAKAGPSGAPWIDTNSGFIRAVRAWGDAPLWLGAMALVLGAMAWQRRGAAAGVASP